MWNRALELVYRPACAACDALVPSAMPFCETCVLSVDPLGPSCRRCAEPMGVDADLACARCVASPPAFTVLASPCSFGGSLADALRRLKFHGRTDIARALAPLVAPPLAGAAADVDVIVPVPLHWRRLAARGFNQAQLLLARARPALPAPIDALALRRVRATSPQHGLSGRKRQDNVRGAFLVPPRRQRRLVGRRVLLFDDVATTGATLDAAARALLAAGAAEVTAFTVARAGRP